MKYISGIISKSTDKRVYGYMFTSTGDYAMTNFTYIVSDSETGISESKTAKGVMDMVRNGEDIAGVFLNTDTGLYDIIYPRLPQPNNIVRLASEHLQLIPVDTDSFIDIKSVDRRLSSCLYMLDDGTDKFFCYGTRGIPAIDVLRHFDTEFDIENDETIKVGWNYSVDEAVAYMIPVTLEFRRAYIKYKSLVKQTYLDEMLDSLR